MFKIFGRSKADKEFDQYKMDIVQLRQIADDPNKSEDERQKAREKLKHLSDYHTKKINGHPFNDTQKLKEETI